MKRPMLKQLAIAGALVLAFTTAFAQDLLIRNATVHTATSQGDVYKRQMLERELVHLVVAERGEQLDRTMLVGHRFGMLEGQVEEATQLSRAMRIVAGLDRLAGIAPRQPVGGEGVAGVAIDAVSYTHLDVYKRQEQARSGVRRVLRLERIAFQRIPR